MRGSAWTVVSIVALALSAGLALGCGATDEAMSAEAGGTSSTSMIDDGSSTEATEASQSVPAVGEMSVFSRPRTEADVLPSELAYRLQPHPCTEWHRARGGCVGDSIPDESRLLLSGLGVRSTRLYAWPTTNGWVCWAWAEGAGGCLGDFADVTTRVAFMGIDPDNEGIGYPGTLVGVVPDDVQAAEVQVRGVGRAAIVESNGIFYELPDGSCTNWAFESLTATYRDGTSDTVHIGWHHGPEQPPGSCEAR
jgi:hypothetical protein